MNDRRAALRRILEQNPSDPLARYGLAMEHVKAEEYEQAVAEFEALLAATPDYLYAYFHAGQALEKMGRSQDARRIYQRGLEAAARKGDAHAQSELLGALDRLG